MANASTRTLDMVTLERTTNKTEFKPRKRCGGGTGRRRKGETFDCGIASLVELQGLRNAMKIGFMGSTVHIDKIDHSRFPCSERAVVPLPTVLDGEWQKAIAKTNAKRCYQLKPMGQLSAGRSDLLLPILLANGIH